MGGFAGNIMVIMVAISVGLMFFGVDSGATSVAKLIIVNQTSHTITSGETADLSSYITTMLLATVISAGVGVAAYLLVGGQMAIYIFILSFLLSFAFMPVSILTMKDIPFMVRAIIGVPLFIGYVFALIGWFRGSDL